jgi:hypothetical protein
MAYGMVTLSGAAPLIGSGLHNKHYLRKHGNNAYYGHAKEGK